MSSTVLLQEESNRQDAGGGRLHPPERPTKEASKATEEQKVRALAPTLVVLWVKSHQRSDGKC